MSEKITFAAAPRTLLGKKSKQLRAKALTPANITGDLEKPIPISIKAVDFVRLYQRVGDTGLMYIKVEGEKQDRPVLVNEVQRDALTNDVVHVMFRQVNLSEKVSAEVPVVTIGEFGVKDALIVTIHDAIKVDALPQDLPDKFEIDVTQFTEAGQAITFNQLQYDRSKVTLLVDAEQLDTPVVMVQAVKEEVEEAPVAVAAEGEAAAPGTETGAVTEAGATAPAADEKKKE